MIGIETPRCMQCGKGGMIEVPEKGWALYTAPGSRVLIQDALPELSAAEREQLITGTHEECWDKLMGEPEE